MGFMGSKSTGTSWLPRKASPSGSSTFGGSRRNSTVRSSIFTVPPGFRPPSVAAAVFGFFLSTMRSYVYTTSSAFTGLPSCQVRPDFRRHVQTEPSALGVISSAR